MKNSEVLKQEWSDIETSVMTSATGQELQSLMQRLAELPDQIAKAVSEEEHALLMERFDVVTAAVSRRKTL
jgi:hypothetical protein